ncbi:MAG TPA: adenosylcobinamide-phosphate synthase CbiB [Prolixibacteraceae bacterium]|nr:adenosylcobinamide-phosphate synthase CbiB [Prolixibacteraceae bacterium]
MLHPILLPLIIGFFIDALIGDPRNFPHPIKVFGLIISKTEHYLNKGKYKLLKGAISTLLLIISTWIFYWLIAKLIGPYPIAQVIVSSIIVYQAIANRGLIIEALKVEKIIRTNNIEAARKQLSTIVGRDTHNLNENQIRVAVLETLSENLSDGVIAPLFYYAIGGFPLMMAYKMVNTLDSMIAYKNDRFKNYGLVAARIDDLANLVPARLTAFLMALLALSKRAFFYIFKYGNKHSSPNSGYPEAALAGILNCRFGGPNAYGGKIHNKPYIGDNERIITSKDICKAALLNAAVSVFVVLIIVIFYFFKAS